MRGKALIWGALAGLAGAPALAERIDVTVVNASGLSIMEARVSPAGQGAWSGDVLGSGIIAAGATGLAVVDVDLASCASDLLVVFDDGRDATVALDPCAAPAVTVPAP